MSSTEAFLRLSSVFSIILCVPIFISGLGIEFVRGLNLDPRPAASINAFKIYIPIFKICY